jgi:hypothetical protein
LDVDVVAGTVETVEAVETGDAATGAVGVDAEGRTMRRRNGEDLGRLGSCQKGTCAETNSPGTRMPVTKIGRLVKEGKVG